jgi:uncharacterized protein
MPRIILDANIIISGLVFGGNMRQILDMVFANDIEMISCVELEKEVLRVLVEKFGISLEDLILAKKILSIATHYPIKKPYPKLSRDKNDNYLLSLIDYSKADILITGDEDLLVLKEYKGCQIIKIGEFYKKI